MAIKVCHVDVLVRNYFLYRRDGQVTAVTKGDLRIYRETALEVRRSMGGKILSEINCWFTLERFDAITVFNLLNNSLQSS